MCWTNKACDTFRFKAGFSFRPLRGKRVKSVKKKKGLPILDTTKTQVDVPVAGTPPAAKRDPQADLCIEPGPAANDTIVSFFWAFWVIRN